MWRRLPSGVLRLAMPVGNGAAVVGSQCVQMPGLSMRVDVTVLRIHNSLSLMFALLLILSAADVHPPRSCSPSPGARCRSRCLSPARARAW